MGERLEVNKINIEYLARKLNSLQSSFAFTIHVSHYVGYDRGPKH